ncbi:MAG: hypothetical protein E6G97_09760 [Alphaproteobacteria bacterium]|nr:MAG: hypothetical protein E6G97_09760 [Alphaproteobacteria bacterium]
MTDIPDSAFEPTRSNEREGPESVVSIPFLKVRPGSGLPPSALTPDEKLASGQRFYKRSYAKCQLLKGTARRILDQDSGCSVFAIMRQCWRVSETWWVGPPKTLVSTTEDDPNQDQYKEGGPKPVIRVFCPEGAATAPSSPPPQDGGDPAVWLPPAEEKWGTGQGTTLVEPSPGGDVLVEREVWLELMPPAQQQGCWITGSYRRFWKVTKTPLPNGTKVESREPYTPDTVETKVFRVPGCIDKVARVESAEPLFDVMASLSGRETWTSVSSVWVPTAHVLIQFQIGEVGLTSERLRTLIERSLTSIHKIAGPLAESLVARSSAAAGSPPGTETQSKKPPAKNSA